VTTVLTLAYLLAAVLFILGLRQLSSPRTARNGNYTAAAGMVIALGATVPRLHFTIAGAIIVLVGVIVGAAVGTIGARQVKMTAIPQMVALFNGAGGGAAALVAVAELLTFGSHPPFSEAFPSVFSIVIGSVSFAGSIIAFAKLQELMTGTPITYPGQQLVNGLIAAAIIGFVIAVLAIASIPFSFLSLMLLALILGVAFVLPIGGADMPVVISLLNAFTGLAVAASGFTLNNFALIVAGTLVGASGSLLTKLMSDAMGRSLGNVLFGAFGQVRAGQGDADRAHELDRRPGHAPRLLAARHRRPRLRAGGGTGTACGPRAGRAAREERGGGQLCDSPGGRPDAGPYERPARRGKCALRAAQGDGRDQRRVQGRGRGPRRGRKRCREPCGPHLTRKPHLRDADPQRGPGEEHRVPEAVDAARVCRYRQRSPL